MAGKRTYYLVADVLGLFLLGFGVTSCGDVNFNLPKTTPKWPAVTVSVSPSSVTVPAGGTQQFRADLQNTSQGATWRVNGVPGGDETIGFISNGVYTAPLSPPPSGKVTITAVWVGDRLTSGSATANIVFSNASLSGHFALSFATATADGDLSFSAGTFQANGDGGLTNGIWDLKHPTEVLTSMLFTGTYWVGPDGRGAVTLTGSSWTWNFSLVVLSDRKARLMLFEPGTAGSGVIEQQDSSAFSNPALSGDFSFSLRGVAAGEPTASVGRFTSNGFGGISEGLSDANQAGAVVTNVPFTGNYNVGVNGRGTLTLAGPGGTHQYSLYILSADRLWLLSQDSNSAFMGLAERQQISSFDDSTLSGDYIFLDHAAPVLGNPTAALGRFIADGAGTIVEGVLEETTPDLGLVSKTFTGIYNISANGRGTMPARGLNFYLVSSEKGFAMDMTSSVGRAGAFEAQQGGPFTTAALAGNFGFQTSQVAVTGERFSSQGRILADVTGNFSGFQDSNGGGIVTQGDAISGVRDLVDPSGRGTLTDPNGILPLSVIYVVSPSKYYILGAYVQPDSTLCGVVERQF